MSADQPPPQEDDLEAGRRYKALFENMSEGLVICEAIRDESGRLTDYWVRAANPVFRRRGRAERIVGRRQREMLPGTSERWFSLCARALRGDPVRFEYEDTRLGRWFDVHMAPISETEFAQFFVDVTERKRSEAAQQALFDELNHRVKNNLAVISSILQLQARAAPVAARAELLKAVDRIRTIGDLHSALYQQNSRDVVDLCPYLEALCERLAQSLFDDRRARIVAACAALTTTVQEAVSLGLIVNELVTNAAKHAFQDDDVGTVEVRLSADAQGRRLLVADDGRGMPAGLGGHAGSLGLRIVRSLAAGLGGEVTVREGPGTTVEVLLPARDGRAEGAEAQGRLL